MEPDLIHSWKIVVASGIWFALSSVALSISLYVYDPDNFGSDPIMITIYALSSLIVGAYYGIRIHDSVTAGPFLSGLAKMSGLILISELVVISIIASLVSLFASGDIGKSLFGLVALGPIILVHFGLWKLAQIVVTIFLLFAGYRCWKMV